MLHRRVMPCLLLRGSGLVKTRTFRDPVYLGDPINVIKIFNEKEVDELIVLDISARKEGREPDFKRIAELATECFMPLVYGGGVTTVDQIRRILRLGVEKVSLNSRALQEPSFIEAAAKEFGSQAIVASIDVKKNWMGAYRVHSPMGKAAMDDPVELSREMERRGAGELLINSVDRDGTLLGYDVELLQRVSAAVGIPMIACGGAGSLTDLAVAIRSGGASAAAAGSLFVFQGVHRAVLINFPNSVELDKVFSD